MTAQWRQLLDHVMAVPERIYETWNSVVGWDNHTPFGTEYGWDGVAWCAIFGWDIYHDVGLDAIVPKTASVAGMTAWAKQHGQWSEYPSIGAWVNFGGGVHTEIVAGFDADIVYTKGGNSIRVGAQDAGQGNGVWFHAHTRRDAYVTGYFAPVFPDGVCPPTADPADPRGGTLVTSWWWEPTLTAPPFPGRQYFLLGATNDHVLRLQTWLQRGDWGPAYKVGPSRTMTALDLVKVSALQQHFLADLGPADGLVGPKTWLYAWQVAHGLRKR